MPILMESQVEEMTFHPHPANIRVVYNVNLANVSFTSYEGKEQVSFNDRRNIDHSVHDGEYLESIVCQSPDIHSLSRCLARIAQYI